MNTLRMSFLAKIKKKKNSKKIDWWTHTYIYLSWRENEKREPCILGCPGSRAQTPPSKRSSFIQSSHLWMRNTACIRASLFFIGFIFMNEWIDKSNTNPRTTLSLLILSLPLSYWNFTELFPFFFSFLCLFLIIFSSWK